MHTSTHAFAIATALRGLDSRRRENGECSEEAEGLLHRHGHRAAAKKKTQPLGITIVLCACAGSTIVVPSGREARVYTKGRLGTHSVYLHSRLEQWWKRSTGVLGVRKVVGLTRERVVKRREASRTYAFVTVLSNEIF